MRFFCPLVARSIQYQKRSQTQSHTAVRALVFDNSGTHCGLIVQVGIFTKRTQNTTPGLGAEGQSERNFSSS